MLPVLLDQFQRPLRNLRLSVTDRCNLRCSYCMPEQDYVWLPREDILQFEEIERLVDVFADLGVDKVRLTGGEPLLRRDLSVLVAALAVAAADSRPRDDDQRRSCSPQHARDAASEAGLHRVTVSLDTLRPDRFRALTRSDELDRVLDGIAAAAPLFPRPQARHRRHPRHQRRRAGRSDRVRPAVRRRGAVHRIHGCRRRDALVDGSRRDARPDAGVAGAALRPRHSGRRSIVGAGRSLPPAGWDGVRHHRVHDAAVLRGLRSQPPDGRWHVVPVSLRVARHGSARGAAPRSTAGRAGCDDSARRGVRGATVAPRNGSRHAIAHRLFRSIRCDATRTSKCTPGEGDRVGCFVYGVQEGRDERLGKSLLLDLREQVSDHRIGRQRGPIRVAPR